MDHSVTQRLIQRAPQAIANSLYGNDRPPVHGSTQRPDKAHEGWERDGWEAKLQESLWLYFCEQHLQCGGIFALELRANLADHEMTEKGCCIKKAGSCTLRSLEGIP